MGIETINIALYGNSINGDADIYAQFSLKNSNNSTDFSHLQVIRMVLGKLVLMVMLVVFLLHQM